MCLLQGPPYPVSYLFAIHILKLFFTGERYTFNDTVLQASFTQII